MRFTWFLLILNPFYPCSISKYREVMKPEVMD